MQNESLVNEKRTGKLNNISWRMPDQMDFEPFKPEEKDQPWVTLVRFPSLVEADLVAAQLRGADIPVFLPDEFVMQAISFNVITYGMVRVQVPPDQYETARDVLNATVVEPGTDPGSNP
jgi:hypothetical protein